MMFHCVFTQLSVNVNGQRGSNFNHHRGERAKNHETIFDSAELKERGLLLGQAVDADGVFAVSLFVD